MNKTCASLPCRKCITGIHAEEDDLQVRVCPSKQTAGLGGGGTVETPIEQEQVGRSRCKGADKCFDIPNFNNAIAAQFVSKQQGKSFACCRIRVSDQDMNH